VPLCNGNFVVGFFGVFAMPRSSKKRGLGEMPVIRTIFISSLKSTAIGAWQLPSALNIALPVCDAIRSHCAI
jgi:hypothetical protein